MAGSGLSDTDAWTRVSKRYLYEHEAMWLAENIGPQRFYLHNLRGGDLWRYAGNAKNKYLEFARARDATLFLLRWGTE